MKARLIFLILFLFVAPFSFFLGTGNNISLSGTPPATAPTPGKPGGDELLEDEKNTIQIYERNNRSVVNITTNQLARSWDFGTVEVPKGMGSGFVWNSEGYIVTNYHVVQNGSSFAVTFYKDSKSYQARIVGVAPAKDIAVLKLVQTHPSLRPISVGMSKGLLVGQKVIAIGNPFGFDQTATTGIVSALDRKIEGISGLKIYGMIQTDASINPGNSGGPLLDSRGRLIGMNTEIISPSGSSAGVGFAVPVDIIGQIVPQLITYGKIIRPALGIEILSEQSKNMFGVEKGIVIGYLGRKSPAAKAGIRGISQDRYGRYYLGDIIVSIDGQEVNDLDDIYNIMDKYKIGDEVEVRYLREGNYRKTKVKLMQLED